MISVLACDNVPRERVIQIADEIDAIEYGARNRGFKKARRKRVTKVGIRIWIIAAALVTASAAFAEEEDAVFRPAPGRDVVNPMRPDWCDGAVIDSSWRDDHSTRTFRKVERDVEEGYGEKSLREIGQLACAQPDNASYQGAVARWRQGYLNLIGNSETENRAAMRIRLSSNWDKMKADHCAALQPGAEDSPRTKSLTQALAVGTGCELRGRGGGALELQADGSNNQLGWWIDERAEVDSEIVRAVYVNQCLRVLGRSADHSDRDWPDATNTWVVQSYATCGGDARRLDRAKLERELADPRFNDFARVHARETFALAKATADGLERTYKKLAAKDEAYRRLLFDAPEAGWKAWETAYAAHRDAFEAARAFEQRVYGPSRRALLGCGEKLRRGFDEYVRSREPSTPDAARRAALDDVGYVLLASLAVCDGVEGRYELAQAEVGLLTGGEEKGAPNVRRGPRFAAYYAAVSVLSDILADRNRFPLKLNDFYMHVDKPSPTLLEAASDTFVNKLLSIDDPRGTIAGVRPIKGGVVVSFRPVHSTVPNWESRPTGHIARIEHDGTLVYGYHLVFRGMTAVTTQEPPLAVYGEVAGGLAVGQTATFAGDGGRDGRPRNGLPKEVYVGKKLVVWYGVRLQ